MQFVYSISTQLPTIDDAWCYSACSVDWLSCSRYIFFVAALFTVAGSQMQSSDDESLVWTLDDPYEHELLCPEVEPEATAEAPPIGEHKRDLKAQVWCPI